MHSDWISMLREQNVSKRNDRMKESSKKELRERDERGGGDDDRENRGGETLGLNL